MSADTEMLVVYCTCPDRETASRIAGALVEQKLAACVSQIPGVVSTYRWEDQIRQDEETLLMIKTGRGSYSQLENTLQCLHPYELPEIVAVPVIAGSAPYLTWIADNITG